MATISRLKPGQIVWRVLRRKMGNTTVSCGDLFQGKIVEVHEDHVIASWNGNKPEKFYPHQIKNWKVNRPEPKSYIMGRPNY